MRKKGLKVTTDEVNSNDHASFTRMMKSPLYNFEHFMNRPHTYNKDSWKCKICGGFVEPNEARFHHADKKLPTHKINKVKNLITDHKYCHNLIHNYKDPKSLSEKTLKTL